MIVGADAEVNAASQKSLQASCDQMTRAMYSSSG